MMEMMGVMRMAAEAALMASAARRRPRFLVFHFCCCWGSSAAAGMATAAVLGTAGPGADIGVGGVVSNRRAAAALRVSSSPLWFMIAVEENGKLRIQDSALGHEREKDLPAHDEKNGRRGKRVPSENTGLG